MLLYIDEAINGYDAYSILKTSHTIFGEYLSLFAKSTGYYRETIYHYLSIPFIYLFGLNEFSLKIVSFLFFSLAFRMNVFVGLYLIAIYYVVKFLKYGNPKFFL